MGDSVSAYQVGSLFGYANDLHTRGILQVVYAGDCPVTWGTSIHCIGSVSQVYSSFLGEFPASHGDTVDDEHCFSSSNRRLVREDHPDFRGHALSMRPGF